MRDTIGHVGYGKTTLQAAITSVLAKKGFDQDGPLLIIPGHTEMNKSVDLTRRVAELELEHPRLIVIDGNHDLEKLQAITHDNSELKNMMRKDYMSKNLEDAKVLQEMFINKEEEEEFRISKHRNKKQRPLKRKKVKRNTCKKRK